MYRHSPLMRSLLSQFRTPTEPRRSVGFFGSGHRASRLARLITQSTLDWLILLCQPFRPSTNAKLPEYPEKSTQTIGAVDRAEAVNIRNCKLLHSCKLCTAP